MTQLHFKNNRGEEGGKGGEGMFQHSDFYKRETIRTSIGIVSMKRKFI